MIDCTNCEATGLVWFYTNRDCWDCEPCYNCKGTGKMETIRLVGGKFDGELRNFSGGDIFNIPDLDLIGLPKAITPIDKDETFKVLQYRRSINTKNLFVYQP